MAGNTIGEAFVSIRPDMTGFETALMAGVTAAMAKVQAMVNAKPISIPITADVAPVVAKMAAARAAADASGGSNGIIGRLLWGTAGIAGFAAFGSIASLAGFGFEHALTTMIGLAGSFAGALGGLAVLAIGVFGKMAVGMGSDMLVMKSVIADTQLLYAGLTAIQLAQLTYGKNSAAAAAATQALNVQMLMLGNTAGVRAELALAKAAQALNHFWDQATSSARVAAVGFLMPFFQVAYTYIPLIAAAATRNFTIMTAAFKPLLAWAIGPGTAIFKNLENLFAASIPVGVHALTQFVELLAKIANFAAPQTGSLLVSIDKFLTNLNTTAGFSKLEGVMTTMIGMFHDWWNLLKQVGITLYDLFSQGVGLGTSIVKTITAMLVQLDKWLVSTSGKASVHNLFAVHLQEVLAILAVLPSIIGAFGSLYLAIAPPLVILATLMARFVGWLIKIPGVGTIVAWGLAIAVFANTMKLVAIGKFIASMVSMGIAFAGYVISGGLATAVTAAFGTALAIATAPITLIILGVAALAIGLTLLFLNWQKVANFLSGPWGTIISAVMVGLMPWVGIAMLLIGHWTAVVAFFKALPGNIVHELGQLPSQILTLFSRIPGTIVTVLTKGLPAILGFWLGLAGHIAGALVGLAGSLLIAAGKAIAGFVVGLVKALPTITKFFIELPLVIIGVMGYIAVFLIIQGVKAITGFVGGLVKAAPTIWNWFISLPGWILGKLTTMATFLINVGISVITGFMGGIGKSAPTIWNWFLALPGVILSKLTAIPGCLLSMGEFLITGFWNGMTFIWKNAGAWIASIPGLIGKAIVSIVVNPLKWLYGIGQQVLQGLWNGMVNIWNSITGWVSGIASKLTHLKGPIEKDAVLLYPQGMAIMQGLHNGLKAGFVPIIATMKGMAPAMKAALGGVGGMGSLSLNASTKQLGMAGATGGGVSIVNNFHVHGGNPAEVQRVVGVEMRKVVNALRAR